MSQGSREILKVARQRWPDLQDDVNIISVIGDIFQVKMVFSECAEIIELYRTIFGSNPVSMGYSKTGNTLLVCEHW